jgi:hypothetical protein
MDRTDEERPRTRPSATARAEADLAARQAREAASLRANLRRRKAQARARQQLPQDDKDLPK